MLRRNVEVLSGERVGERFGLPIFPTYPSVTSRERLVRCLGELGEFEEAIRLGEDALRIAEELDHGPSFTAICLGLGTLYMRREDLERAIPVLERGVDVGRRGSIYLYVFSLVAAVGRARVLTGRPEEGLALMTEVVKEAASKHAALGQSTRLTWLAEGLLIAGRPRRAWARGEEASRLSRRYHEKGQEVWTLHLLGDIAARRDPPPSTRPRAGTGTPWRSRVARDASRDRALPPRARGAVRADGAARDGPGASPSRRGRLPRDGDRPRASARRAAARAAGVMTREPGCTGGSSPGSWPRSARAWVEPRGPPRATSRRGSGRAGELEARAVARLHALLEHAAPTCRTTATSSRASTGRPDASQAADLARVPLTAKADLRAGYPARTTRRTSPSPAAAHDDVGLDGGPLRVLLGSVDAAAAWEARTGSGSDWAGTALWHTRMVIASPTYFYERMGPPGRSSAGSTARSSSASGASVFPPTRLTAAGLAVAGRAADAARAVLHPRISRRAQRACRAPRAARRPTGGDPLVVITFAETATPAARGESADGFRRPVVNYYSCWEVPRSRRRVPTTPTAPRERGTRHPRVVREDGSDARRARPAASW